MVGGGGGEATWGGTLIMLCTVASPMSAICRSTSPVGDGTGRHRKLRGTQAATRASQSGMATSHTQHAEGLPLCWGQVSLAGAPGAGLGAAK